MTGKLTEREETMLRELCLKYIHSASQKGQPEPRTMAALREAFAAGEAAGLEKAAKFLGTQSYTALAILVRALFTPPKDGKP